MWRCTALRAHLLNWGRRIINIIYYHYLFHFYTILPKAAVLCCCGQDIRPITLWLGAGVRRVLQKPESEPVTCNMILGPMSAKNQSCNLQCVILWSWVQSQPNHTPTNQSWNLWHAISWSWVQCQPNHTLQQIKSWNLRCAISSSWVQCQPNHIPPQSVVHQVLSPAPFPTSINQTTTSLV